LSSMPEVKSYLTFVQATSDDSDEVVQIPKLFFSCEFAKSRDENLFYQIVWCVNDQDIMKTEPMPYSKIENANLTEDDLRRSGFKLDINIKCRVYYSGSMVKEMTSPEFWAGIKIITPAITIKQGQIGEIHLQSTVPFGCVDRNKATKCILPIEVLDLSNDCEKGGISIMDSERCGTKLHGMTFQNWIDGKVFKWGAIITLTTRDIDDFNQMENSYVFSLRTSHLSTANEIMNENFVHVEIEKAWVRKSCYAHGDPHMRTFDQIYYDNQNIGEFVLYRHTTFKQEVQMKTYRCGNNVACACAASIRAGGELFIIDICNGRVIIKHASCKEQIMIIQKINEYTYEIYMPLGTMVVVTIVNWPNPFFFLNIDITPSVKDVGRTVGLCGKLNNDARDDFTTPGGIIDPDINAFSISWRIDCSESFLNPSNHNPCYWEGSLYLCACPFKNDWEPVCSPNDHLACTKFPGIRYDDCSMISNCSRVSHRKEMDRILAKRASDIESYQERHTLNKRSAESYTMEKAKEICKNIFEERCPEDLFEGLSNNIISRESAIHECILDLSIIGDLTMANSHCSSLIAETERYIRKDSILRHSYSNLVESFYARTCLNLNNCNWNGKCIEGKCVCYELYTGEDCSISIKNLPDVLDTYSGGLCSTSHDECCGSISIYGHGFVSGVTTQLIITFEVFANGKVEIQEKFVKDLQIINAFEAVMDVPCKSPEQRAKRSADYASLSLAYGVTVSVSNDGSNYGAAQSFYVFDTKCQGFIKNKAGYIFYILDGTCYIDGVCYLKEESSPSDVCKRCRPEKDPYSFSTEVNTYDRLDGQIAILKKRRSVMLMKKRHSSESTCSD
ncbi:hypothetical protein ACJMK2_017665, partial [Sinanodonta woodiana]